MSKDEQLQFIDEALSQTADGELDKLHDEWRDGDAGGDLERHGRRHAAAAIPSCTSTSTSSAMMPGCRRSNSCSRHPAPTTPWSWWARCTCSAAMAWSRSCARRASRSSASAAPASRRCCSSSREHRRRNGHERSAAVVFECDRCTERGNWRLGATARRAGRGPRAAPWRRAFHRGRGGTAIAADAARAWPPATGGAVQPGACRLSCAVRPRIGDDASPAGSREGRGCSDGIAIVGRGFLRYPRGRLQPGECASAGGRGVRARGQLDARHANYRFNLATSFMYYGELDAAEREYEACIAIDPGYWRAHLALSQLRRQTLRE